MQQMLRRFDDERRRPRPSPSTLDITMRIDSRHDRDAVSAGMRGQRVPLGRAVAMGLLSEEGYLTPLGFAFWHRDG